jgi:hypothetical protein
MSSKGKWEVAYKDNDTEFMDALHHALLCAQAEIKLYGYRPIGVLYPDSGHSTAFETADSFESAVEEIDQTDHMDLDVAVDDSGSGTLEMEDLKLVQAVLDTKEFDENEEEYEAMIDRLIQGTFDTSQDGRNQGSGATREDAKVFEEHEEEYEAMIDGLVQGTYETEHYGRNYELVPIFPGHVLHDDPMDEVGQAMAPEQEAASVGERLSEELRNSTLECRQDFEHRSNAPSPDEVPTVSSSIPRNESEESFVWQVVGPN